MLVLSINAGHDGAVAAVRDHELLFCIEAEKDSFPRYSPLRAGTILSAVQCLDRAPDVVAVGGWNKQSNLGSRQIGAGYLGADTIAADAAELLGASVRLFNASHERSHIFMAVGMAPADDSKQRAVLVYEGHIGKFYLLDDRCQVTREFPVLKWPGRKYSFLFALADPTFPDDSSIPRADDAGKLMALAAYGDEAMASSDVIATVDRILELPYPAPKIDFRDSPLYNAGLESDVHTNAAALLTRRIFEIYSAAALEHFPPGIPLHISGGCGLNCDWNAMWRELEHFSSVFVPPCANDSGSALGTAIDAVASHDGETHLDWSVYSGLEFEWDSEPDSGRWERRDLDYTSLAEVLAHRHVVAWVQGRWELGPRALGNRSILAEPFDPATRTELNRIKGREGFRPIAPCCRIEDMRETFLEDFEDPYMLYFRRMKTRDLGAVTHVDGSARAQTVRRETNKPLHELLTAFAEIKGVGVLCNTSLNFKGLGFINRMSDLVKFCETQGIPEMVVGRAWFRDRHRGDGPVL